MKRFFVIISILFFCAGSVFAQDYESLYENQKPADFKLIKGIDPFQENDYLNYAWAPYPLFRLSRVLYYKDGTMEPGYYLLVPREMKGHTYIFFKENGTVKHIVPVYKTETLPPKFYDTHIPKPAKTKGQKFRDGAKQKFNNIFKGSKQQSPPQAFISTSIIEDNYYELTLYFGQKKYCSLLRINKN